MATLARASIQLEDFSGELKDREDKTILNATALEQRLSSQILQTQEQIQQTVTEQYFQLEDFSGELKDREDKTILNATALEQRLSSQILQTQEQIQQTVTEQYFTKDETNKLIQQAHPAGEHGVHTDRRRMADGFQ